MRILHSLTYYRPNVSGLTIYVERIAGQLVERGHEVTVLTARHDDSLPLEESIDGIRVVRVPVAVNVGKGPIMPTFPLVAQRLAAEHDVVNVHLPQFEAVAVAVAGRLQRKPVITTYHCDLQLPGGIMDRVIDETVFASNFFTGKLTNRMVAYTRDYAVHSRYLSRFGDRGVVIPPPIVIDPPDPTEVAAFRQAHGLVGKPVLGFASRLATEKGIEFALDAHGLLIEEFSELTILFAGPWEQVVGEEAYRQRLLPRIEALGDRWQFVGTLGPATLPTYYGALDALLMTSINSTESFGLVQVEAMFSGTPVVATDLPGVRQPVVQTGMGEIVRVADADSLANGIRRVLRNRSHYVRPREEIEAIFDLQRTVDMYETVYREEIAAT